VSWGTREDPRPQEKNDLAKTQKGHHLDLVNNGAGSEVDGDWSIGCGSACRLLCCLKPDQLESSPQFIAMLCHRFGTLAHIIASTELFCFRKTVGKLSEDELVVQNAVEIARELQAIRGVDESREHGRWPKDITYSAGRADWPSSSGAEPGIVADLSHETQDRDIGCGIQEK
ncbi:hypothetical protein OSTOST_13059, partial [Ostertagia ostertagi]